jgi:UDP-2-acetamido-3-amino-2,3-dideoxy-glucuronate N-acetyltransferase
MAVFDDTCPWPEKLLLFPHEITWKNNIPVPAKAESEKVAVAEAEPLLVECRHFLDCIVEDRTPRTDGREGLKVLQVLNAAQESLDGGQRTGDRGQGSEGSEHLNSTFVHETAVIDHPSAIGQGTKIWHFSHVLKNSRIGDNCTIGQNVAIGPEVTVGDNCKIQNNVSVYTGVTLEDGVFCGPSMVFTNVYNPRAEIRKMDQVRPTRVRQGATIGANATIICGVSIGRYAFIGAGAVVTRDVPDHALVFGNPARTIGWMCRCGERLDEELSCGACGLCYQREGAGLRLFEASSK